MLWFSIIHLIQDITKDIKSNDFLCPKFGNIIMHVCSEIPERWKLSKVRRLTLNYSTHENKPIQNIQMRSDSDHDDSG